MKDTFLRKATCIERLFVALAGCGVNAAFRLLIRIDREPSVPAFEKALHHALENCRAANLKYRRGKWYVSDYVPKFELIESELDDIYAHPISVLDHRKHTLLLRGIHHKKEDSFYISAEFFHGACDGRSALNFVYDIFSSLNGKPLTKYRWDIADAHIVKKYGKRYEKRREERPPLVPSCRFKPRSKDGSEMPGKSLISARYRVGEITGKLSYAISKMFSPPDIKTMIPVDIRAYSDIKDAFLFGNFTLPIFCQCGEKKQAQILKEIKGKLKSGAPLSRYTSQHFATQIPPLPVIRFVLKQYIRALKMSGRLSVGALVSYLGVVDASRLENPFFEVQDVTFRMESVPLCGCVLFALGFEEKLNVSIACKGDVLDEKMYGALKEAIEFCVK